MKKIKWCIIGAGGIADRRAIPALLCDKQNEIVAVMDKVDAVAKQIAEKYGVEHYYSNAEEMLAAVPCDAVYIATPVFCHYEHAMLALKYNAHVFMEKPLALNYKEGKKIVDAFKSKNKQLIIGYMMGYHNLHCKAHQLVQAGKLGSINTVRLQFSCWYPEIPGAWRQQKSMSGGGCIMDLAVHCMELFYNITGDRIAECKSFFGNKTFSYEVEDSAVITFRSKNGIYGIIDVNFNIPDNCSSAKLEIYGTEGSIYAEGTLGQEEAGRLKYIYSPQGAYEAQQNRSVAKPQLFYGKKGNIYLKQFKAFNKLILSQNRDYTNADRALEIQGICDSIYNGK
ncbi:MAG: Gfo/Idh/MocA family oxidoreductase [Clostridia bacterium]|nr:Gfo/Idh/MocA family oxidoreductase [Clostridia bacterium]